jgi:hypothetical protein
MKETGLMFKAPLVRAILAGQKTQTRRIAKTEITMGRDSLLAPRRGRKHAPVYLLPEHAQDAIADCPYGQPGDRIYVRETFVQGHEEDPITGRLRQWDEEGNDVPKTTWYRATDGAITWSDDDGWETNVPWKPAIHMPKALARIWLEVTGVRVERLQDISESDCWAEGIEEVMHDFDNASQCEMAKRIGCCIDDAKPLFAQLWESTGGDWAANPWVWVIDFKRIEKH